MHRLLVLALLLAHRGFAQGTASPLTFGRSATGRVAYLAEPPATAGSKRLAWWVQGDRDGHPELKAYSFLLSRVVFSLTDSPARWPSICDQFWNWNDIARRFEPAAASSGLASGTPQCTFRGTIYFKGWLMPRIDVRPEITVSVEGPQGAVPLDVHLSLDERRSSDLSGFPAFLGEISTTALLDGPQHLRVDGGYREFRIDGNPATPEFEEGGDATTAFLVANHPPRLVELAIREGSATVYDGAWILRPGTPAILSLTRTGGVTGLLARRHVAREAKVSLRFSVPVNHVAVELRRSGGTALTLDTPTPLRDPAGPKPGESDELSLAWQAILPLGSLKPGEWAWRVSARDADGHALERLTGEDLPLDRLSLLLPDSGNCVCDGQPCRLGPDTSHRITVLAAPPRAGP
jgi:hypothetical protein